MSNFSTNKTNKDNDATISLNYTGYDHVMRRYCVHIMSIVIVGQIYITMLLSAVNVLISAT
jgi:hypothetical protein